MYSSWEILGDLRKNDEVVVWTALFLLNALIIFLMTSDSSIFLGVSLNVKLNDLRPGPVKSNSRLGLMIAPVDFVAMFQNQNEDQAKQPNNATSEKPKKTKKKASNKK